MIEEKIKINYQNEITILKFDGEVVFENSNQLKEETKNRLARKEKTKKIILNLSQSSYLDSSGVGVILSLFKFIRRRDGTLAIVNPNKKIRRVFEITKLIETIPVYETIDQAFNEI